MTIQITSTTDSAEAVAAENSDLDQGENVENNKAEAAATEEQSEEVEASSESEENADEVEAKGDGEDEDGDESAEDKPKKKGGFQKRIEKLNTRLGEREKELEYWRAQAIKGQKPEDSGDAQAPAKAEAGGKPVEDDFETHAEFIEALTDWKLEQKELKAKAEAEQAQAKTEYQKRFDAHQSRIQEFKKQHADYGDVVSEAISELGEDFSFSAAVEFELLSSEMSGELMYELAKNPKEIARLNTLSPSAVAREFGKLEARLALEKEKSAPKEAIKTKAPKPIASVGSKTTGTGRKSIYDPDLSQADYERLRAQMSRDA